MTDFQRRKEKNILNSLNERDEQKLLSPEQSKFYEISMRYDEKIKKIEKDITMLKCQLYDILHNPKKEIKANIFNNNNVKEEEKNSDSVIKGELLSYIKNEIKLQLKEQVKLFALNDKNNYDIIANNKNQLEFDIKNINKQLLNQENSLLSLNTNKLNKNEFELKIKIINDKLIKLNNKVFPKIYIDNGDNINEDDIFENKQNYNENDLKELKKDICMDFEKVNSKILNELKHQAGDIQNLYREMMNFNLSKNIRNNLEEESNSENNIYNYNKLSNSIQLLETQLKKKVNIEQLNYALKTQTKLNEALTSSLKLCRLCWNTKGILTNNKFIKWSMQNINTALDVFKWENNSEIITILQKGVYKIVVGLIGLEINKNIIIICDEKYDKFMINNDISMSMSHNTNNYSNQDNIKYIEKYIACVENTRIKICLLDENNNEDNSEEAFLEIKKII